MSARLTKTLLARVATDVSARKESAAQAKELKKRRKEAAKSGHSASSGKRPAKKRKLKRKPRIAPSARVPTRAFADRVRAECAAHAAAPSQSSVEPSHGDQPEPAESPHPKL